MTFRICLVVRPCSIGPAELIPNSLAQGTKLKLFLYPFERRIKRLCGGKHWTWRKAWKALEVNMGRDAQTGHSATPYNATRCMPNQRKAGVDTLALYRNQVTGTFFIAIQTWSLLYQVSSLSP